MAESKARTHGYQCPVRGCPQRNNRRFSSPMATAAHIIAKHGELELVKRLKLTTGGMPGGKVKHFAKDNARQVGETPAPVTLKAPHEIVIYRNGTAGFCRTINFDGDVLDGLIVEMAGRERFTSESVHVVSETYKTSIMCKGNY